MPEPSLLGARIFVVDDEAIIALDLHSILAEAGAFVIGPARTLDAAQVLAERSELAAAILDVRLGSKSVLPVAKVLADRGIPFAFYTGDAKGHDLASNWPDVQILTKPAERAVIIVALARILQCEV